jgi:putative ABC transport system permease protein
MLFLGVAALLVNMVLARLLGLEREQIATLKALGYGDREIARHYLSHAVVTALLGALLGAALGTFAGRWFVTLYGQYYRFPSLTFRPSAATMALGALASVAAAAGGAMSAVRAAVRIPPAEAMRPEAPARYRPTLVERLGLHRLLPTSGRMVLRELGRRPGRAALSTLSVALAAAIIVAGRFSLDSLDVVLRVQFGRAQRDDLTVTFARELPRRAAYEVARLPGVLLAEPQRAAAVRLRRGVRVHDASILGLPRGATLRRVFDERAVEWAPPAEGMLLSRALGERLGAAAGDAVTVEDAAGVLPPREVAVAGLVDDLMGLGAYMDLDALHRLRGDGGRVTAVAVRLDPARADEFFARVRRLPAVASASRRRAVIDYFRHETSRVSAVFTLVLAAFAGVIAVGVVYNNARIALSVRGRELATLRVLGFTEGEVAAVLLGEQGVVVAAAIPLGLALGRALAAGIARSIDAEMFRLPVMVSPATYALAAGTVVAASAASAWVVRRRIAALDMVSVLKSRD